MNNDQRGHHRFSFLMGSGKMVYNSLYILLLGQRSYLEKFKQQILSHPEEEAQQVLENVDKILNANYGDLFDVANDQLDAHPEFLMTNNPKTFKEAISNKIIMVFVFFLRFPRMLLDNFYKESEKEEDINNNNSGNADNAPSIGTVVCRLCDEKIPVELFEEHVHSCAVAYQARNDIEQINEKLENCIKYIKYQYLQHQWPGDRKDAIDNIFPMLHLTYILKDSAMIDLHSHESRIDLITLHNSIDKIRFANNNKKVILEAKTLINSKIKLGYCISEAVAVLKHTRVSGSGKITTSGSLTIADFKFIKRVSSGAYARVFLVQKIKTGDIFAIKVTKKSSITHKNQAKQLMEEKNILLTQAHNPFIVDFCKNNLYMVMEYLPGGDLFSLLQNVGSFDEQTAKTYSFQILLALKFLHSNGVVHRDIKPDNILIAKEGRIKLTDFGLSHRGFVDRHANQTEVKIQDEYSLVGTPDYTAPEIILGKPHSFTADYWSFGIMLYEFLFGIPPFHADTETETHANIVRGQVDYSESEEFSPESIDLIQKLLVLDPHRRLGANGPNEILEHPWFRGFDLSKTPPPFIPQIRTVDDTSYFQDRDHFAGDNDNDIVEDLKEANKCGTDEDMPDFCSLSFGQLMKQNEEVILKIQSMPDYKSIPKSKSQNVHRRERHRRRRGIRGRIPLHLKANVEHEKSPNI